MGLSEGTRRVSRPPQPQPAYPALPPLSGHQSPDKEPLQCPPASRSHTQALPLETSLLSSAAAGTSCAPMGPLKAEPVAPQGQDGMEKCPA